MYGTIQVKIKADDVAMDFLVHQCKQSNSLINSAIFAVKQAHYEDCPRTEYDIFNGLSKSYRKHCEASLQSA